MTGAELLEHYSRKGNVFISIPSHRGFRRFGEAERALIYPSVLSLLGAWAASAVVLLDWNTWWQVTIAVWFRFSQSQGAPVARSSWSSFRVGDKFFVSIADSS